MIRLLSLLGTVLLLAGCSTAPSGDSSESTPAATERPTKPESRGEERREPLTATETAVAERRTATGGGGQAETAKLVDQLNEAARELATLRTANAKLRAERERPRPTPAPEVTTAKADPADERLAASLKSYAQFKQEMTNLIAEVERLKKASVQASADLQGVAEQLKQAKAAVARAEEDARVEKRLRREAEATAAQLREQLRTIARAMAAAGLNAEKLTSQAETGTARPAAK